ncbi:endonuclease domain-containing protein [Parasphingopyxis sp.]|uniref:endonuclease domain-containing protein n=1 Tax=Parasphingopyxis sp. TaxID=1920299 RepID=UPI0026392DA0|nr:endonuclease domain-containing protein [Parasphingopyxis sp.]
MGQFQPRNTKHARDLRNAASPAERKLWQYLSRRQLAGHKFSRQMPVGPYYCDFLCRAESIVIEIDGASHDSREEHDKHRTRYLESRGLTVLRFTNEDVLGNIEGVLQKIEIACRAHPQPLPQAGGAQ